MSIVLKVARELGWLGYYIGKNTSIEGVDFVQNLVEVSTTISSNSSGG